MRLNRMAVSPVQYYDILKEEGLLEDTMMFSRKAFIAAAMASEFYEIACGRRRVGIVVIGGIIPGHSCNLHVVIDKRFRGLMKPKRRIGKVKAQSHALGKLAAAHELLRICFEDHGVRKITTGAPYRRKAANRLNRRLGFKREGVLREAASYDGKIDDIVVWGMTRKEYERLEEGRIKRMAEHGRRNCTSGGDSGTRSVQQLQGATAGAAAP